MYEPIFQEAAAVIVVSIIKAYRPLKLLRT